jgi:hypothetical protein
MLKICVETTIVTLYNNTTTGLANAEKSDVDFSHSTRNNTVCICHGISFHVLALRELDRKTVLHYLSRAACFSACLSMRKLSSVIAELWWGALDKGSAHHKVSADTGQHNTQKNAYI